ncbi:hypothetical protein EDB85DRAFT_217153 [Lactarius pseudohatsudake]|nr:hypothetical protein EDB85DRAFT_217153 [Lactarius pseudohatsudake]
MTRKFAMTRVWRPSGLVECTRCSSSSSCSMEPSIQNVAICAMAACQWCFASGSSSSRQPSLPSGNHISSFSLLTYARMPTLSLALSRLIFSFHLVFASCRIFGTLVLGFPFHFSRSCLSCSVTDSTSLSRCLSSLTCSSSGYRLPCSLRV